MLRRPVFLCLEDLLLSHCFHIAQRKLGCWPRDVSEFPSRQPISAIACHLRRLFDFENFRQKRCSVEKRLPADKSRFLTMTAIATQTTMVFRSIMPAIESVALVSLRQTLLQVQLRRRQSAAALSRLHRQTDDQIS